MDLSSLYNTLSGPPDRLQQAENEMMERFKGMYSFRPALKIVDECLSALKKTEEADLEGYVCFSFPSLFSFVG
jgi:hypothetical protein